MKNLNRRDFLKVSTNSMLALAGVLGLAGLIRYLSYEFDSPPRNEFDIGPETDYPLYSQTVLAHIPAIIIHDDQGIQAMSLTCTHLGCMVEQRNFGYECPCHGSRYSRDGKVTKGPATANLPQFRIKKSEDGNLHVFRT
jgi:nitrite reductase/ring-hydroxylating ferredoxin subunit